MSAWKYIGIFAASQNMETLQNRKVSIVCIYSLRFISAALIINNEIEMPHVVTRFVWLSVPPAPAKYLFAL